ncbi:hypothetical protein Pelo_11910 [Pelomyxa schiedti]|nr:hypothetical protein Pelo_11910 [Pelomyxa schiedti]
MGDSMAIEGETRVGEVNTETRPISQLIGECFVPLLSYVSWHDAVMLMNMSKAMKTTLDTEDVWRYLCFFYHGFSEITILGWRRSFRRLHEFPRVGELVELPSHPKGILRVCAKDEHFLLLISATPRDSSFSLDNGSTKTSPVIFWHDNRKEPVSPTSGSKRCPGNFNISCRAGRQDFAQKQKEVLAHLRETPHEGFGAGETHETLSEDYSEWVKFQLPLRVLQFQHFILVDPRIGQTLEVMDTVDKWYGSTIIDTSKNKQQILIHYEGWSNKWNEWIHIYNDCHRLWPHTETASTGMVVPTTAVFKKTPATFLPWKAYLQSQWFDPAGWREIRKVPEKPLIVGGIMSCLLPWLGWFPMLVLSSSDTAVIMLHKPSEADTGTEYTFRYEQDWMKMREHPADVPLPPHLCGPTIRFLDEVLD